MAPTEDIGHDDRIFLGVEGATRADHSRPPAARGVARSGGAVGVRVTGKSVEDEDGVVFGVV